MLMPLNDFYHAYFDCTMPQPGLPALSVFVDFIVHHGYPDRIVLRQISRNKERNQQAFPLFPFRQQKVEMHKIISIQIQRYIYIYLKI